MLTAGLLCAAIALAFPDAAPPLTTCEAIVAVATLAHPAEQIASLAWGESRFDWRATNGPVAGPMQVKGPRPRTELAGYRAGVAALVAADAWCVRRGTPTELCALAVYASGPRGARERLFRQPRIVMARAERLRVAVRAIGGES